MNILEILLIFLSTLIFIPPVLFFSQMNKEIIKKKEYDRNYTTSRKLKQ